MRNVVAAARRLAAKYRPTVVQVVGAAGVSWGMWERWPWVGKTAGGALLVLFGVASERSSGGS